MEVKQTNLWKRYKFYWLKRFLNRDKNNKDGLPSLKDKLFISILLVSFPVGLLVYIPSIIVSLDSNAIEIAIVDTLAIFILLIIVFNKRQSLKSKKILFSINLYILSVILLVFMGTNGPGLFYLLCISVLITLYHSNKAGLISVAINAVLFLSLLFSITNESIILPGFEYISLESWITIAINLIACNVVIILSVSFLIDHLQKSYIKEQNLKLRLQLEGIELLNAKIKSEESDRLKSAFLANMSHEIRTPMNGILGFSELLKSPDLKNEKQLEYIGIIEKSGRRMLDIINDIIDISKIESGQMSVSFSEVNINTCMDESFDFFYPEAEKKGIKLVLSKNQQNKNTIIKTDRDKLNGILTNLINNAIKYTQEGAIEFGFCLGDNKKEIEFFVKDTGIGIPSNKQTAIFERFIQADIENIMARQGAGLGLAITKAYVEMLGGKIWLESEENNGSTFYFTLPFIAVEEFRDVIITNNIIEKPFRKLKILIVEDDETSIHLLGIGVKHFGKEIIRATNGIEAVKECLNNPDIDLVLMDIQMPIMNGYEATRKIREFNKEVVIIAQTAFALSGDKEKSIAAGCNDYISKPIIKTELESLIRRHIIN